MEPRSQKLVEPRPYAALCRHLAQLTLATTLLCFAAQSSSAAGAAKAADDAVDLAALIRAEQARNGPYSTRLLDLLNALILKHEEDGDLILANAMIEQALLVVRANYGLYALEQAPLLERRIRHEEESGNFKIAWDLEEKLLEIVARNPSDLRAVPILRDIGDRRLAVLDRYLNGEFPPQLVLGCYYNPAGVSAGSCVSGSKTTAVRAMLADARHQYMNAIDVLVRNEEFANDELVALELEVVRASYREGNYLAGRSSLRRIGAYAALAGQPAARLADIATQIADWDLLFAEPAQAVKEYEQVILDLGAQRNGTESIATWFAPDVPVALPTFLPNPLESRPTSATQGYVDIAFEISRFGRSRRIRVLDTSTHPSPAAHDALRRLVAESRFRPQLRDGELADRRVTVRYYPPE